MEDDKVHKDAGCGAGAGAPVQVPSLAGVSPAPVPRKLKKQVKLSLEQEEAALKMHAHGMEVEQIAAVLGFQKASPVARCLKSPASAFRLRQMRAEVVPREMQHGHELWGMMPQARKSLSNGLTAGSVKNQTDIARWLHEALVAKPAEKQEIEVRGRLEHDLSPVLETIEKHLAAIREANGPRGVLERVKPGDTSMRCSGPDGISTPAVRSW